VIRTDSTDIKSLPRPQRLLVVLPSWLGDTVMATPALRALRSCFAESHIAYAGRAGPLAVLADAPWADETVEIFPAGGLKASATLIRSIRTLARRNFDCAVLLPNSFGSALTIRLAGIKRRLGYVRDGRGLLLTDRLIPAKEGGKFLPGSMIRYYLALSEYMGAEDSDTTMELFTCQADERVVDRLLELWGIRTNQPVLVVHPGGGFGPSKRWPAERFARVADELAERYSLAVLISAGPAERAAALAVKAAMKKRAVNLAEYNVTIGQLKALVRRSRLMITNDTGPRHFGPAFGVAVVTIFGSTDPLWTDTFFGGERVVRAEVDCGPCQKRTCKKQRHVCMDLITPEMVLAAAVDLLDNWPGKKS